MEDETNADLGILRNRVRHDLLPRLARDYRPSVRRESWPAPPTWRTTTTPTSTAAADTAAAGVTSKEERGLLVDGAALLALPAALGRRVVVATLEAAGASRAVRLADVERVLAVFRGSGTARSQVAGVAVERFAGDRVLFSRGAESPVERIPPRTLEVPGEVEVPEAGHGWRVCAEGPILRKSAPPPTRLRVLLEADRRACRHSRCGGASRETVSGPSAWAGTKTLQDLFVDRKVPRAERDRTPVVVDAAGRIVWVVGLALAEAAAAVGRRGRRGSLECEMAGKSRPGGGVNSTVKSLVFWSILFVVGLLVWNFSSRLQRNENRVAFSEFVSWVDAGQVQRVEIVGNDITGVTKGLENFRTYAPFQYEGLANRLIERGVSVESKAPTESPWAAILYSWAPILLMIGFWIFFMRQVQSGGNKALSFGKSKAKLSSSAQKKVTFRDVAGVDEAKDELQEIIEFLKEPQKFQKLGGRIPKGVLLMGPPGTGKTLLARAVAGEANVPFFSISGSDFVEMFVGVGASRVRDLFEQGKKNAPCIVFIDEIDAVGRHRGAGLGGGHDEREQTLNQLLVEMDGFESNEGVILVAATNRPDVLDPALLRPGRFDRRIVVNRPDVKGREGILHVHTKKIPMADDVDIKTLARGSAGFAGADLANLVNEAALNAARLNKKAVAMVDFEFAKDKVLMGAERRSMIVTEEEKRVTAIHEAGHALLAVLLPQADALHKVTIIPRGMALGLTTQLPLDEKHNYSKVYLMDRIAILLGGRIAEEITTGDITTGAGNDLERSTEMARKMVCEWGMSDVMGPLTYGKKEEQIFLGREIAQQQDYSGVTAERIDQEVKRIVSENYDKATTLLTAHKHHLLAIAEALLARESLDGEQVKRLVDGLAIDEVPPAPVPPPPPSDDTRERPRERERAPLLPIAPKPLAQE